MESGNSRGIYFPYSAMLHTGYETRRVCSCSDRDPLNSNKIQQIRRHAIDFQTKFDNFADPLHEHIE